MQIMTLDLTDEEKLAVVAELKRTINNDSLSAVASRPDAKGDPGEAPAAGRRHRRAASDSKARGSAPCGAGRHEAAPTRINSLSGAPMRLARSPRWDGRDEFWVGPGLATRIDWRLPKREARSIRL